jgi:outer membrane lipoprotein-sorting protein
MQTSNIDHRMPAIEKNAKPRIFTSLFDVGRSMLDVRIFCLLFLCINGCPQGPKEKLSTFAPTSVPVEIQTMVERSKRLKDISGSGTLQLTQPDGQSVVFDLAVAMQPPDRARIRAWKMGQAVLDLIVLPDAVWLETSQQGQRKTQITGIGDTAARITRALCFLNGGFFDDSSVTGRDAGDQLILTQQKPGEPVVTCIVDRATLSPRQFRMVDSSGVERFSLKLEDYKESGGAIWPRKVTAISAAGTVVVSLDDVDINAGLPPRAFIPPARAEKLQ